MLGAAVEYARARRRVLPLHDTGKLAKTPIARAVRHGLKDASADPETVRRWWMQYPDALIGVVVPAALIVIDNDPRHGGDFPKLERVTGPLPRTLTCWSGRGDRGAHRYFHAPAGMDDIGGTKLPDGFDLRKGGRSYCIVAPSLHPDTGRPYEWEKHPVAACPPGLAALLRVDRRPPLPRGGRVVPSNAVTDLRVLAWLRIIAATPMGKRHKTLLWLLALASEAGVFDEYAPVIAEAAKSAGWDARHVDGTVRWARGMKVRTD